jgi:hypothetical protein
LFEQKRRERINERLKTLQTLVPNGTKVDMSTMLEEAVQYVKFLQLQIKVRICLIQHFRSFRLFHDGIAIDQFVLSIFRS